MSREEIKNELIKVADYYKANNLTESRHYKEIVNRLKTNFNYDYK